MVTEYGNVVKGLDEVGQSALVIVIPAFDFLLTQLPDRGPASFELS